MNHINIFSKAGSFAENKDVAREIRLKEIIPVLNQGKKITLDFSGVDATTQSFIHALLSDVFRKFGGNALEMISFQSCNIKVQKIIEIVADYMQESMDADDVER